MPFCASPDVEPSAPYAAAPPGSNTSAVPAAPATTCSQLTPALSEQKMPEEAPPSALSKIRTEASSLLESVGFTAISLKNDPPRSTSKGPTKLVGVGVCGGGTYPA